MNETWTDELSIDELRKVMMVITLHCDFEFNCHDEVIHAIQYQMAFGIWRWVFFCECHGGMEV